MDQTRSAHGQPPGTFPDQVSTKQEASGHPRRVPPLQVRAKQATSVDSAATGTCTLAPRGVTAHEWPSTGGRWLG